MYNLKIKINKQKQSHKYGEQTDGCQMEGGMGMPGKKGDGIKKYKLVVMKQSWGCKLQNKEYSQ